jgi:hypothetical protein
MIQAGRFRMPPPIQIVCAVVLYKSDRLESQVETMSATRNVKWKDSTDVTKDDADVTILPGNSTVKSTGPGRIVLFLIEFESPSTQ